MKNHSFRHGVKVASEINHFIGQPSVNTIENSYDYPGLKVRTSGGKGLGVFATQKLIAGTVIPYGGIFMTEQKNIDNIMKNAGRSNKNTHYLVDSCYDVTGVPCAWLDANPRKYPPNVPKFAWIASLVNEPSDDQAVNATLVYIDDTDLPQYPQMSREMNVFINCIRDIDIDEEILVSYGYSIRKYRRLGYTPADMKDKLIEVTMPRTNATKRKVKEVNYTILNRSGILEFKKIR